MMFNSMGLSASWKLLLLPIYVLLFLLDILLFIVEELLTIRWMDKLGEMK